MEQDRKAVLGCLAAVLNIASRRGEGGPARAAVGSSSVRGADDGTSSSSSAHGSSSSGSGGRVGLLGSRRRAAETAETRRRLGADEFRRELLRSSAGMLSLSSDHAEVFYPNLEAEIPTNEGETAEELLLRPFLASLSSRESSFRCVALLLFRFLLQSGGGGADEKAGPDGGPRRRPGGTRTVGYDARVRRAYKRLAVAVLSHWDGPDAGAAAPSARATRKFEALEGDIASRLAALSDAVRDGDGGDGALTGRRKEATLARTALRGAKVGAAGLGAGVLFAVTGGLAAPAIVGGIAALAGASTVVTAVASALLLPAATTVFGAAGGTLVAGKMKRRTAGLEEFGIERKVGGRWTDGERGDPEARARPELSRTVCISGWLRDPGDFDRPFGVAPPSMSDLEIMRRFCSVYAPRAAANCERVLEEWKGREDELYSACEAKSGRDPRKLLPFDVGARYDASLTKEEDEALDELVCTLGLSSEKTQDVRSRRGTDKEPRRPADASPVDSLSDLLSGADSPAKRPSDIALRSCEAWDFHARYGSELYVVRWEERLLLELNGSVRDLQRDMAKGAGKEILKKTAMASLLTAIAIPSALLSFSNIIDEKWTLAKERSDEAGVLLAQSLMNSRAGHRPVNLVGFSFGARMILSCLGELARCQTIWETRQQQSDSRTPDTSQTSRLHSLRRSLGGSSNKSDGIEIQREPASIVEDVILMGTPASVGKEQWSTYRGLVAGRLVNCYSKNDMILALMYRAKNLTSSLLNPPVGISRIDRSDVENIDVSDCVGSHGEYCVAVRQILETVGYNQPMVIVPAQGVEKETGSVRRVH